eukprot:2448695-Rhodomonas_salina.2
MRAGERKTLPSNFLLMISRAQRRSEKSLSCLGERTRQDEREHDKGAEAVTMKQRGGERDNLTHFPSFACAWKGERGGVFVVRDVSKSLTP